MFKQSLPAPAWDIETWINTDAPIALSDLRGLVVVAVAFQMLCPGCVTHALPQLERVQRTFPSDRVAVIGLHTVFEHHDVMAENALRDFAHEYRLTFPIGIDRASDGGEEIPRTMTRYKMRGTPTLLLIDADGNLRDQQFGHSDHLQLDAKIATLLAETHGTIPATATTPARRGESETGSCADGVCRLPG